MSINLFNISSKNLYIDSESTNEEVLINKLPNELLNEIFSYLSINDLQSYNTLCKSSNKKFLPITAQNQQFLIKQFIHFVYANFNEKSDLKEMMIAKDNENLNFRDLTEIKLSICKSREKILNILKNLKFEELDNLEKLYKDKIKPRFFENTFFLARIYKKIDAANAKSDENQDKDRALEEIVRELANKGYFHRAIKVAYTIKKAHPGEHPDTINQEKVLSYIAFMCFFDNNKFDVNNAIKAANTVSSEAIKGLMLKLISKSVYERRYSLDDAFMILYSISNVRARRDGFIEMAMWLRKNNERTKSFEAFKHYLKNIIYFKKSKDALLSD